MACAGCERRRKALIAKQEAKKAKGRKVQAAAIGAVLAVTEAVGKAINGEVEDEQDTGGSDMPSDQHGQRPE